MNNTKIDWCDCSYNPVTGCLKDCPYCYAKEIVKRFQGYDDGNGTVTVYNPSKDLVALAEPFTITSKFGVSRRAAFPYGFDPTLHEYRLDEPFRKKRPKTIFVCSMADLFGSWVPDKWIEKVFDSCRKAPWHRYLFLTKNPSRYIKLKNAGKLLKGDNVWYGATCTNPDEIPSWFSEVGKNTFLSVEPLLQDFGVSDKIKQSGVKWVIVGAMTGVFAKTREPKTEWICNLILSCGFAKADMFFKSSLTGIVGEENMLREFPWEAKK